MGLQKRNKVEVKDLFRNQITLAKCQRCGLPVKKLPCQTSHMSYGEEHRVKEKESVYPTPEGFPS